jgi:hypothetical protein
MSSPLLRKNLLLSTASALVLVMFILMAGGSIIRDLLSQFYLPEISRKTLDNGQIQETHEYRDAYICEERVWYYKATGYYDTHMRWHGLLTIEKIIDDHGTEKVVYTEEVMMVHGKRDGLATTTHSNGLITYKVYNMGHEVEDLGGEMKSSGEVTAFSLLDNHFSWQQEMFNEAGYDDAFLEELLDTFEMLLDGYEFGPEAFDSIYGEVEDRLDDTRFDTLLRLNTNFYSFLNGMELLKEAEFRMAVIDQYHEQATTLFEVIQNTYPGYLTHLETDGVARTDFEVFSQVFDSCMISYGPLDNADPLIFIDSLDTRIYRALTGIYAAGQSKSAYMALRVLDAFPQLPIFHITKSTKAFTNPPEVAELILYDLLFRYVEGNVLHQCIWKSWAINHGMIMLPTVTTYFDGSLSPSSAGLTGFVLEEGGAPVTARGMVWADHYDPTLEDHTLSSDAGTGSFSLELEGLMEGETYYVRTFATNSAGTSYGNCVSFTFTQPTDLIRKPGIKSELQLFPNPATEEVWLKIEDPLTTQAELVILQINGQVVYQEEVSRLLQGTDRWRIDLSKFAKGTYIFQIREHGWLIASQKLIVIK